jgi:ABC-type glycerol-3-phosphate transport system substrate-binding protein
MRSLALKTALMAFGAVPATAVLAQDASPPADTTGELVVWHYMGVGSNGEKALEQSADLFRAAFPNVTVKLETFPFDQLNPQVLTAAGSENGPDVLFFNPSDISQMIDAGAILPLDPHLATWAEFDQIPDNVIHRFDDQVYTIQAYVNHLAMWANKAILDEVGAPVPTTFEELEAGMAAATGAGYIGLTLSAGPGGVGGWWNGTPFLSASCETIDAPTEAGVQALLERMRGWIDQGFMRGDVVTQNSSDATSQFLTGNWAYLMTGNWDMGRLRDEGTFEMVSFTVPTNGCPSSVYLGGEGVALGAYGPADDALAFEFIARSLLSAQSNQYYLTLSGSIPMRKDVVIDPATPSYDGVLTYVAAQQTGLLYPVTAARSNALDLFGDLYSAALSGQTTPAEAAARIAAEVPPILAGQ